MIPDKLGLLGLLDDAYLSRALMDASSKLYRQTTGRALLSTNLEPANRVARDLIGPPASNQLDNAVATTIAQQAMQVGLQQLTRFTNGFPLQLSGLGGFGLSPSPSYSQLSREADLRLAAMGGPPPR